MSASVLRLLDFWWLCLFEFSDQLQNLARCEAKGWKNERWQKKGGKKRGERKRGGRKSDWVATTLFSFISTNKFGNRLSPYSLRQRPCQSFFFFLQGYFPVWIDKHVLIMLGMWDMYEVTLVFQSNSLRWIELSNKKMSIIYCDSDTRLSNCKFFIVHMYILLFFS